MFIIEWLTSFGVKEWFAEAGLYVVAIALIAAGFYLAFGLGQPANPILSRLLKPLRWMGFGAMFAGLLIAGFAFGRSHGAAACEAAWKAKNYEAQIAELHQEAIAKTVAAKRAEEALSELRGKSEGDGQKIENYREAVGRWTDALRACRASTPDDDARICEIVGGCKR